MGWVPQARHPEKCEKPSCCPRGLFWSPNWEPGSKQVALRKEYGYMSLILIHLPSQEEVWKFKPGTFGTETLRSFRTCVIYPLEVPLHLLLLLIFGKNPDNETDLYWLQEQKWSGDQVSETAAKQNPKNKGEKIGQSAGGRGAGMFNSRVNGSCSTLPSFHLT